MATALAVERPRWRRIFCSLFLVAVVVAAVAGVATANQGGSTRGGDAMANPASVMGNDPLLTYAIDDGTAEGSIGRIIVGELLCL